MVPDRCTDRRSGACPTPGACASHCNRANTKSGPVANAVRHRSGRDLSTRAGVSRRESDVRVESVQLPTADIDRRGLQVAFVLPQTDSRTAANDMHWLQWIYSISSSASKLCVDLPIKAPRLK